MRTVRKATGLLPNKGEIVMKFACGNCLEFIYEGPYCKGFCKAHGYYYYPDDDGCSCFREGTENVY